MALSAIVGTITTPTATGNQPYTGLGFQPKVLIFWGNNIDISTTASYRMMLGCAVSTSERWVVSAVDTDNVANSTSSRSLRTNRCIEWISTAEAVLGSADLVSMDSDGFTLDFSVVEASARFVHVLALGGTDLTNVFAGSFDVTTSASDQAVTGVLFAPDCVLLAGSIANTTEGPTTTGVLHFGMMTATGQWAISNVIEDIAAVNNTFRAQRTDRCLQQLGTTGAVGLGLSRESLDADGFTVNKDVAPAANRRIPFLCLKGAQFKVGSFSQPTSNGASDLTGVGFTPSALLMASFQGVASTAVEVDAWMAIGAGDAALNEASAVASSTDATDPTESARLSALNSSFSLATGATPTLVGNVSTHTFNSDGASLTWANVDGTAREICYWAIGATAVSDGYLLVSN